jgi:hypothetical protein
VDDGVFPLLGSMGPSSIGLYTGSNYQQTWLANIAEQVDVSKIGTIDWNVDPNVGPTGEFFMFRLRRVKPGVIARLD